MAFIEPLVGHLLSQYKQTVQDGLDKITVHLKHEGAMFANIFAADGQAVSALLRAALKTHEHLEHGVTIVKQTLALCTPANRVGIARVVCSKDVFPQLRTAMSTVTEANLTACLHAIGLLAAVAAHSPKVVLSRFAGTVPLHLPCFKPQLPFGLRRIRNARLAFLAALASSKHAKTTRSVLCTHGFLTQLLEDAAEVLRQDDGDSLKIVTEVLDVVHQRFIAPSSLIDVETRKQLLVSQRNILRILIKALSVEPIAERCAAMLYQLVDGVLETSADYALARTEVEDKGMPNFIVFTILRSLHPKQTAREAALVCYILNKCPDLIRPYFVRVSVHLSDETNVRGASGSSPTSIIAAFNVLTRSLLAPIPFHLQASVARLQPTSAASQRFFSLTPRNMAEEVCPAWLGEFIHKRINNQTNLANLLWAIQVTQAALNRAAHVHRLIHTIYDSQTKAFSDHRASGMSVEGADLQDFIALDIEQYEAAFLAALESFLPKREEFWHRMTQQLHKTLSTPAVEEAANAKTLFVVERLNVLMDSYTSMFRLRVAWLSAAPSLHPRIVESKAEGWKGCVANLLRNPSIDVLNRWTPKGISTLCNLLCSNLVRGVQMPKLHHINTGNAPSTAPNTQLIADWPLLLSLMSWYCVHRTDGDNASDDVVEALAYINRLVLLTVHSVSVRYAAEFEEIFLWLSEVEPTLLPMFLHLLNHMMARSLSKTSERVAAAMTNTEHGVLVECATLLITKAREKKEQPPKANDKQPAAAKGTKQQNNNDKGNVWQTNLEENLSAFEALVQRIKVQWPKRQKLLRRGLSRPAQAIAAFASSGRKQLEAAVLAPTVRSSYTTLLVDVLGDVCHTTNVPQKALSLAEDATPHAVETLPASLLASQNDQDATLLPLVAEAPNLIALAKALTKKNHAWWLTSSTIPWAVVRRFAALGAEESSTDDEALTFSNRILTFVAAHTAVEGAQVAGDDGMNVTHGDAGLHALLLALLQAVLGVTCRARSVAPSHNVLVDEATLAAINAFAVRHYGGTLSTADRLRYAVLLHVHYVRYDIPDHVQTTVAEGAAKTTTAVEEAAADGASSDSDDNEEAARPSKHASKKQHDSAGQGVLLQGCVVPFGIRVARFVTEGAATATNITREIDVLAQLLDSWTDADAKRLTGPVTLSNSVYVRLKKQPAATSLSAIWRAVFPDVLSSIDRSVADIAAASSGDDMDPRYLLPLVNTVAAIASAHADLVPPHLLSRMFSFTVRALSYTCATLRRLASNILALSAKYLTPQRRTLINYARLRTLKQEFHAAKRGAPRADGAPIMRLPTAISSFIIGAQGILHRYNDHLHNDVLNFLADTPSCLSARLPLDHLLTAFPLGSITHALMVQKQDELVNGNGHRGATSSAANGAHKGSAGLVEESGTALQAALEREAPKHLQHILANVSHSSGTLSDARSLVHSGALSNVLAVVGLTASHPNLRLHALKVVSRVCQHSAQVASTIAIEGQVLSWLHGFALQLTEECAGNVDSLCSPLFDEVLSLTATLLHSLPRKGRGGNQFHQDAISAAAIGALDRRLKSLRVSSKKTWDAMARIVAATNTTTRH